MRDWLDLLRRQYNYRLGERFHWYERNRCDINACPLICHIPELKDNPDFYSQKRDLVTSKVLFPEYGDIPSQVLQNCIERVKKTFDRWLKGDSNGKKSGKPRFKGIGRYRSFTFPQIKQDCIADKFIKLPSFGDVKLIQHRPLPDGFQIKTASIVLKSDGWYVVLSLQDTTVPVLSPDAPEMENTIGIDLGLKSFLTDDSGEEVAISRHYRRAEKRLKRLQRGLSRKKKGSNRRKKAIQRVSKAHLKVSNQRKDFHYKTAQKLLHRGKHVAHEKLNIKGLARTRLAKSINDAGWNQFLQILSIKAENGVRGEFPTSESGTPQGDVISPLLANIVLHGLENVGHELRYKKIGGGNIDTIKGFRYADDVVFILKPGDDPEFLRTYIDNFLVTRGLKVKEVKTKVLHSTDGFDFFGWDFKVKPNGKFISTPSQKATSSVKAKVKEVMKDSRFTLEQRIDKCGSIVRGWRNCHRFCDMSQHDLWATAYWTWKFIRKQGRIQPLPNQSGYSQSISFCQLVSLQIQQRVEGENTRLRHYLARQSYSKSGNEYRFDCYLRW